MCVCVYVFSLCDCVCKCTFVFVSVRGDFFCIYFGPVFFKDDLQVICVYDLTHLISVQHASSMKCQSRRVCEI